MKGYDFPNPTDTSRATVLASTTTNTTAWNQVTIWAWLKITSDTDPNFWFAKTNAAGSQMLAYARFNTGFNFLVNRATTSSEIQTNQAQYTMNVLQFFALTFDVSGGTAATTINVYVGNQTTPASEVSYTARVQGSGAVDTNLNGNLIIGNRNTPYSKSFGGMIYEMGFERRYMSLQEVHHIQFCSEEELTTSLTSFWLPFGETGDDASVGTFDRSGNGNDAGIAGTGITLADSLHSRPFPFWGYHQIGVAASPATSLRERGTLRGVARGVWRGL